MGVAQATPIRFLNLRSSPPTSAQYPSNPLLFRWYFDLYPPWLQGYNVVPVVWIRCRSASPLERPPLGEQLENRMTRCYRSLGVAAILLLSSPLFAQLPGMDGVPVALNPGGLIAPDPNVPNRPIFCSVTSNPLVVRVEGLAELLGDIVITCRGNLRVNRRNRLGYPAGVPPTATQVLDQLNLGVTLSVPLTSRLTSDPMTEVLLFIDEPNIPTVGAAPNSREQNPCTGAGGVCAPLVAHDGNYDFTSIPNVPGSVGDGLAGAASPLITVGATQFAVGNPINVFQAGRINSQAIAFNGVPISFYDTRANPRLLAAYNAIRAANGGFYSGQEIVVPFTHTYRIKNLRGAIAGNASINSQIFAYINIQNPAGNLQLDNAGVVIGQVNQGLVFSLRNAANTEALASAGVSLAACVTINRDLAVDPTDADPWNGGVLLARFTEGYNVAFKVRGFVPGQSRASDQFLVDRNYNTESGFYNMFWTGFPNGLGTAGLADQGTRLRIVMANVPANVRIYTSVAPVAASATIGAYQVLDQIGTFPVQPTSNPALPFAGAAPPAASFLSASLTAAIQGVANLPLTAGGGPAAWEVYAASSLDQEALNFLVAVAYRAGSNPGLGAATIQGSFAPISTVAVASGPGVPIPRFVDTGSPARAFAIVPCLTNLLFPYITNQVGFNTGIAISNTSLTNPGTGELFGTDTNLGIAPQSGACTLNYFGTTGADGAAPPPSTTGIIPAGRTFVMTLSSGSAGPFGSVPPAQNFQGYMIAQCNFRYAHGYAFIADNAFGLLAQGYLALIMDGSIGTRTGNAGETLGN